MLTTGIIEFGNKFQRLFPWRWIKRQFFMPIRRRFIMTDYEAWDLGAWAYCWKLRWRFFFVRHDHLSPQEGGVGEEGLGPWRLYILCGNIESQFGEFYEMSCK